MIDFKDSHFERDVILWGVRWYVAYLISYRQLEEMMEERGVEVDHSTLNRWVVKYAPELDSQFRSRKRSVGSSWRVNGGEISGHRGGVKPGQLSEIADMQRGPIGPLCMSAAKIFRLAMSGRFRRYRDRWSARRWAAAPCDAGPSIA